MYIIKVFFWLSLAIILYNYIGYGLIIFICVKIKRFFFQRIISFAKTEPEVTLLVAAYNEEYIIEQKIKNTLSLNYPKEKLKILFITDGSTDSTADIIAGFPQIQLLHRPERSGKSAAINRAMQYVNTPIIIFCDANTMLNKEAVKKLVSHYANPQVGGVAGEKKIVSSSGSSASATDSEGIYWKYESLLKKWDAELYTVVGAAGELFSIRTELYEPVEKEVILDDFIISLRINQKGYLIKYEPEAYAMETPSSSMAEEQKRKIRISAGGFQSIVMLRDLLNIFKYPMLSFQYISHRVLRWTLAPLGLSILFITNLILFAGSGILFYKIMMLLQIIFYSMACLGYYFAKKERKIKLLYIAYYFTFMNISVYQGFARFIRGNQSSVWEKSLRGKIA